MRLHNQTNVGAKNVISLADGSKTKYKLALAKFLISHLRKYL